MSPLKDLTASVLSYYQATAACLSLLPGGIRTPPHPNDSREAAAGLSLEWQWDDYLFLGMSKAALEWDWAGET